MFEMISGKSIRWESCCCRFCIPTFDSWTVQPQVWTCMPVPVVKPHSDCEVHSTKCRCLLPESWYVPAPLQFFWDHITSNDIKPPFRAVYLAYLITAWIGLEYDHPQCHQWTESPLMVASSHPCWNISLSHHLQNLQILFLLNTLKIHLSSGIRW